jgi:hypothetical protein
MGYKTPDDVISPKSRWKLSSIICNTGQGGFAVAEGEWDNAYAIGLRWNGDDDTGSSGNPQSHGNPTWFVVPHELESAVLNVAADIEKKKTLIVCTVTRPDDFQHGVFRVEISVKGPLREKIEGRKIPFEMPRLQKRFFRIEADFRAAPSNGSTHLRGQLNDGAWHAIVQTNGIDEDSNPTTLDVVKDALIASVLNDCARYFRPKRIVQHR